MYGFLTAIGVLFILIIAVHIFFRVIKFTISVFLLGIALIGVVYVFQKYLGIDLIAVITGHS